MGFFLNSTLHKKFKNQNFSKLWTILVDIVPRKPHTKFQKNPVSSFGEEDSWSFDLTDLRCDLSRSRKVKGHGTKWKPIYDFLYVCNTNAVSISRSFRDICENSIFDLWPWNNVKGHATKMKAQMISYMEIIQGKSLSLIYFVIFVKIAFLTFDLGPRSKVKSHGSKRKPILV